MVEEYDAKGHAGECLRGVKEASAYLRAEVLPVVDNLLNTSPTEKAFMGGIYRLAGLLGSLARLDGVQHFQSVASVARTIFEVSVDLQLLAKGSESDFERFQRFPSIERFRSAERLLKMIDEQGIGDDALLFPVSGARDVVTQARREELEGLVRELWPGRKSWPNHWSGIDNLRARCKELGTRKEVEYLQAYSALSWQVHPGSTSYLGKEPQFFDVLCAWCYNQARIWAVEGLRPAAQRLKLNLAIRDFGRNTGLLLDLGELMGRIAEVALQAESRNGAQQP